MQDLSQIPQDCLVTEYFELTFYHREVNQHKL